MGAPPTKADMLSTLDLAYLRGQIDLYWDKVVAPPADCTACQLKVTTLTKELQDCEDDKKKVEKKLEDCKKQMQLMVIEFESRPPKIEYREVVKWKTKVEEVVKWKTKVQEVVKWKTKFQDVVKWRTEYVTKWKTEFITKWKTEYVNRISYVAQYVYVPKYVTQYVYVPQVRTQYVTQYVDRYVQQPCYQAYNYCSRYFRRC